MAGFSKIRIPFHLPKNKERIVAIPTASMF